MGSPHWAVGKNVAVKAANFNKAQQFSTNAPQQVQYQSLKNLENQQISIHFGIWFGTRWSATWGSRAECGFGKRERGGTRGARLNHIKVLVTLNPFQDFVLLSV
jgi:hypothetical protein